MEIERNAFERMRLNDDLFDSFLAALTGWAHYHKLTWTWEDAGLKRDIVEVEGHILVLRT